MALSIGDIITYNGTTWVNQRSVAGSFGIGITNPGTKLDVVVGGTPVSVTNANMRLVDSANDSDTNYLSIQSGRSANAGLALGDPDDGGRGLIYYQNQPGNTGENMSIWVGAAPRVYIDQNGKVGIYSTAPTATLSVVGTIATAVINITLTAGNSPYQLDETNSVVFATNASGAARDILLPTAGGTNIGRQYTIKRVAGSNTVNVKVNGGGNIDSVATVALTATNRFIVVVSDGNQWYAVSELL
jgi:hypothetical protein